LRFPGSRNAEHYFPVTRVQSREEPARDALAGHWYLVGLDQVIVDIEVQGGNSLAAELGLIPGESVMLSDLEHRRLLERLSAGGFPISTCAGGTVGNTLNNFTYLSGEPAVLLGTIDACIRPHGPAFHYVAQTPGAVNLDHLVPVDGSIATALTVIGADGERSFAVGAGVSNDYPPQALPEAVISKAAAVLTTLYCLRDPSWPIARAATRMMELAHQAGIPVALGMGTANLVRKLREPTIELLRRWVTLAAMNAAEAEALTGQTDALLACSQVLEWVDLVIITEGPRGLTMGGYVDEAHKRETDQEIRSKSIPEYNRWEYSRLMRRLACRDPRKVFTHIHPYRGGPERLANTSGAGDAALAGVLHDIAANQYHRTMVPDSDKHSGPAEFLTYSSLSRNAQYGNRVAYEVLRGRSPRLDGSVGPDEEAAG
jgi:inosine kinase